MDTALYARWFRDSTPYIRAHRDKTFVVMLGGDAIESPNIINTMHDLALLNVLGIRIVIVFGPMETPDRAPDAETMRAVSAGVGALRSQLEAMLSTGLPSSPLRNSRITLVSGNFVSARPQGVIDGVDQMFAGVPRRIDGAVIHKLLEDRNIVLVPPVGYSTAGEAYLLDAENLAAETAIALGADKLLVYDRLAQINGYSDIKPDELTAMLDATSFPPPTRARIEALLKASRHAVPRCHLISFEMDGAILTELFTAEGVGTQVSEQDYRTIRQARTDDVAGVIELIRPLERDGSLVRRPRDRLEQEIEKFWVAELDGILIGCCALYGHGGDYCELACVATHPSHRRTVNGESLGQALLKRAEQEVVTRGIHNLFVLTTQAEDWFADNGFKRANVADLPANKQALYNYQRNSKVMIKQPGKKDGR
ncbi:MAG: amino-acid N-acetyltransferase [Gammaproteobacteria bacterium]|nr:amino-acid N-acetyltransferase [Gammaproteobacteria bacterium]